MNNVNTKVLLSLIDWDNVCHLIINIIYNIVLQLPSLSNFKCESDFQITF
jgi:hypothetical protein